MVKIGIICEGTTEEVLFLSDGFKKFLITNGLLLVNVINAEGSGNLLPHNREGHMQSLRDDEAEKVLIVTDLDADVCITITKNRINAGSEAFVVIAVKQIEAWFLASTQTMRRVLNKGDFEFMFPENETEPFETINQLLVKYVGRGIGKRRSGNPLNGKIKLLKLLITAGLDISEAAAHPNCPSAAYFINKLKSLT